MVGNAGREGWRRGGRTTCVGVIGDIDAVADLGGVDLFVLAGDEEGSDPN